MSRSLSFESSTLLPVLVSTVVLLSGCGGGGGGGGGGPAPAVAPPGGGGGTNGEGIDAGDLVPVAGGPCRNTIGIDAPQGQGGSSDIVEFVDTGAGCDYLIAVSTTFGEATVIEPGVVIALGAGVTVEFSSDELEIRGSTENPVTFQRNDPNAAWGRVVLGNRELVVENARFLGGGRSDTVQDYSPATYGEAAVLVSRLGFASTTASISGSVFSGSESAGLMLGSRMQIESLTGNTFSGNASYSLITTEGQHLDVVSELDTNRFGGATAQPVLFDMEGVGSSSIDDPVFRDIGVPYMFANLNRLLPFSNTAMLIMSGVDVWFDEVSSLIVSGAFDDGLHVLGEADRPVRFSGLPGREERWGGIAIGPASVLRHFEITGGGLGQETNGASMLIGGRSGNVPGISGGTIVEHGLIRDSQGFGLRCEGAFTGNVVDLSVEGSAIGDIEAGCGFDPAENSGLQAVAGVPDYPTRADECGELLFNTRISTPFMLENSAADCDYLVVGSTTFGSNLRVEAGTTIVFDRGASMETSTLVAEGTADAPVTLRGSEPLPGYWTGLVVSGNNSSMRHVRVRDAGWNDVEEFLSPSERESRSAFRDAINSTAAGLTLDALEGAISDVSVSRSAGAGLFLDGGATLLEFTNVSVESADTFSVVSSPRHVGVIASGLVTAPATDRLFGNGVLLSDVSRIRSYVGRLSDLSDRHTIDVPDTLNLSPLDVPWFVTGIDMGTAGEGLVLEAGVDLRVFDRIDFSLTGRVTETTSVARLLVNGTEAEPVSVSGFKEEASDRSWNGIRTGNGIDVDYRVNGAILRGASVGVTVDINGGSVRIADSTFRDGGTGVACGSFTTATIDLSNVSFTDLSGPDVTDNCPR